MIALPACPLPGQESGTRQAPGDSVPEVIALREGWLVAPGTAGRGRVSLPTDRLEWAWLQGKLSLPDRTQEESPSAAELPPWKRVQADEQGTFTDRGLSGGWLATFVDVPEDQVWLLAAQGHGSVRINDVPRCGDVYSNGSVELPVLLQSGTNTLIFAGSRGGISARLRRPEKDIFLSTRDTTFPHIIRSETNELWGALLLVNATNELQSGLRLDAVGPGFQATETSLPNLLPLSFRKIAFRVQPDPSTASDAWQADKVPLTLALFRGEANTPATRNVIDQLSVDWNVRHASQTHRRTFLSDIDGSVQYYAVVPPLAGSTEPNQLPSLFLSLHGAGVEGEGQAAVYLAKPHAYVIAPTNRRPFGFDWEDWGRWDALEVLQQASTRFHTDPQRTYLTGHSMGGHGTWHIGSLFPDRFAAIGPSAGWVSFSSYAGGPSGLADDPVSQMLRRPLLAGDTLARIQNLTAQGVYVLHGDRDDNVPVEQARTMREQLAKFHPDFVYKEQPGAGHWWGNACCDWPPLFAFCGDHVMPRSEQVERVNFVTPGPNVSPRCFWVTVAAQQQPGQLSRVDLQFQRDTHTISGTTENVRRLALQLSVLRAADAGGLPSLTIAVDGTTLSDIPLEQKHTLWLERADAAWSVGGEPSSADKGPQRGGPLKEAFRNRFVLVYGTEGAPDENAWMLARARFDAETFWYRGNGSVDVIADSQWKTLAETDRSVVVYGNATINSAWRELLGNGPVLVERGRWQVSPEPPRESSVALWVVRPRPGSSTASVAAIGGTDLLAMRATNRPPIFSSGTGYPDLLVVAPDYLEKGVASVLLAGYFGVDWSFEKGDWARRPD